MNIFSKHRIAILLTGITFAVGAQAQEGLDAMLRQIETNNRTLQAQHNQADAQKLETQAANNLPDPTLSYSHLWDSDDKNITVGELVISQGFDFPTLYGARARQGRTQRLAIDAQTAAKRQDILLQAKEVCLDIVLYHNMQQLLDERLHQAEQLAELYERRLATGDASSLETNKIRLELLNVRTEARNNASALHAKLQELSVLNGGEPLAPGRPPMEGQLPGPAALGLTDYTPVPLPADFAAVCPELLAADPTPQAMENQRQADRRQISISKQGWLPKLELGYRRNTETRHPLNGIVVGFSFPLFENRTKVKTAKVQALGTELLSNNARLQASSALWQLYDEARNLHASIEEYKQTLASQRDLELLRQALDGGQISMIEYFVEVAVIYQSKANLLQLENRYQKVMAQLYKSRL